MSKSNWPIHSLYGDGERFLKQWFQRTGKRDQIFLATKFGYVKSKEGKTMQFEYDTSYEYTKKACQTSLDAMGTEYIDLCELLSSLLLLVTRRPSAPVSYANTQTVRLRPSG